MKAAKILANVQQIVQKETHPVKLAMHAVQKNANKKAIKHHHVIKSQKLVLAKLIALMVFSMVWLVIRAVHRNVFRKDIKLHLVLGNRNYVRAIMTAHLEL